MSVFRGEPSEQVRELTYYLKLAQDEAHRLAGLLGTMVSAVNRLEHQHKRGQDVDFKPVREFIKREKLSSPLRAAAIRKPDQRA